MSHHGTENCTSITPECPVEETIYGYLPSIGANAFGVAVFSICLVANLGLGWRYKTWTYMIAMSFACATSIGGYAGRVIMHDNPWNSSFELQIILLTFSPAFNTAAIYVMLKHIVLQFGSELSRIPPRYYPWGFISADILALILQGAGGGISATADDDQNMQDVGDGLLIAGIIFQVVTLAVFGTMITDYIIRRARSPTPLSRKAVNTWRGGTFRIFAVSLVAIYTFILIRCIYRIAELAGGWRNSIMQDEALFIGLDTVLMCIATLLQSFIHPGIFFPAVGGLDQQDEFEMDRKDEVTSTRTLVQDPQERA